MKYLILLALLATTANADYFYAEIGAGKFSWKNVKPWDDKNKIGGFIAAGHVWELTKNHKIVGELGHLSNVNEGPPFNDNKEPFVNYGMVKYRYEWH